MVSARAQFLGAGHYQPIAELLVNLLHDSHLNGDLVMEVGAGTAYYLSRVVNSLPGCLGLAIDLSKYAARRAARAHERVDSIVADVWDRLPVADGASALTLVVFAPRQPQELHRTLRRNGRLMVVTPQPHHLIELRELLGFLKVDPSKEARLARGLGSCLRLATTKPLEWTMHLKSADVAALAAMGPSARHLDPARLSAGIARLPNSIAVTAAVTVREYRRL
jgi:Methylase involved in ubiquinone/menaquinone biosynthesis